jgi:DNA-binding transcriptional LysR family regulator
MDWNDLKYLLALKRAGTLAAAARELGVDHSTVSRRLSALEDEIGNTLFRRTPDGLVFTEAGEQAAVTAEAMERSTAGLLGKLAGADDRDEGVVRLTIPEGFIPRVAQEVARLHEAHPGLKVELLSNVAALDLLRGEADVALRLFRPTQQGLVTRLLGKVGWSLYASEAYLARKGLLASLGDLSGHELIAYGEGLKGTPGQRWLDENAQGAAVVMRGGSMRGVQLAIAQGLGIGSMPCFVAADDSGLRRMTPETVAYGEAHVVTTPDLQKVKRVRRVMDGLSAMYERDRALYLGALA